MKITIIGYSGGGKTTLAKKISKKFSIPHQQLDRIWFTAGGHQAENDIDRERVRKFIRDKVLEFAKQESWVSDGLYSRAQSLIADQADYVIVLELPLWRRLFNHWKRILNNTDRYPEVTKLQDFLFSYQIIKRTFTFKSKIEKIKADCSDKLVILKNHKEVDNFFDTLVRD